MSSITSRDLALLPPSPIMAGIREGGGLMAGNKVSGGMAGGIWFAGWLFTLGFAQLVWWKAILGLVVWPYYLAVFLR
jgi:hypothetical protein